MSFEERYFSNLLASINITQNAILRKNPITSRNF